MPENRPYGKWDPDWCISPGETLRDWMDENGLSPRVTATACHLPVKTVEAILKGRKVMSITTAAKLAQGTGIPGRLWLNLERAYRDGLAAGKIDASSHAR